MIANNERVVYTLRLPKHTDSVIKERARHLGISQNAFILGLINRELDGAVAPAVKAKGATA